MNHTPGPWTIVTGMLIGSSRLVAGIADEVFVCSGAPVDDTENLANARLIAAAPALLEACQIARLYFDDTADALTREATKQTVSAAIKLATGQS